MLPGKRCDPFLLDASQVEVDGRDEDDLAPQQDRLREAGGAAVREPMPHCRFIPRSRSAIAVADSVVATYVFYSILFCTSHTSLVTSDIINER